MGLFRRGIKDGVAADATVLALAPTEKAARQEGKRNVDYELRLRVGPPGRDPYDVVLATKVPWDKTPLVGGVLPVTVSASDPGRVEVRWDDAPSLTEAALASGEAARRGDVAGAAEALGFELRDPDAR